MTSIQDLVIKWIETENPVTKSVYREIIHNRLNHAWDGLYD